MVEVSIISGSGFYDFPDIQEQEDKQLETKFGEVTLVTGMAYGHRIAFLARHGSDHSLLPNKINYRANLVGLKNLGVKALILTSICGVLNPDIPLTRLFVFDDMYFPENRLPNGDLCTVFNEIGEMGRGHYMFGQPFSETIRNMLIAAADEPIPHGVYAHVNGPRFNSRPEIQMLQDYAMCVSQTAGPEIVLAGELGIPCALLGFGVDYANGVAANPTPVEVLLANMELSKKAFIKTIKRFLKDYKEPEFDGFVCRFD